MNYTITEEQIKKLHDNEGSKYVKEWFPEVFKTKLGIGKWYVWDNGTICFHTESKEDYGINSLGEWVSGNHWLTNGCNDGFKPATDSEVFEALKNEAIKRGFKDGVYVERPDYFINKGVVEIRYNEFKKLTGFGRLIGIQLGGNSIFENGKWATIIPTLTKEEAEKKLNVKIV